MDAAQYRCIELVESLQTKQKIGDFAEMHRLIERYVILWPPRIAKLPGAEWNGSQRVWRAHRPGRVRAGGKAVVRRVGLPRGAVALQHARVEPVVEVLARHLGIGDQIEVAVQVDGRSRL